MFIGLYIRTCNRAYVRPSTKDMGRWRKFGYLPFSYRT